MIEANRRFDIFQRLKKNRTLVKLQLLGHDYDRLTLVTEIGDRKDKPYFVVDYPHGFREAAAGAEAWNLRFEFIGEDNLLHHFKTSGVVILPEGLRIPFPDVIERRQRRKHFRLHVPPGTRIYAERQSEKLTMSLINVSVGGAFGALARMTDPSETPPVFNAGEDLTHLQLRFPAGEGMEEGGDGLTVWIKKARVLRIEKNPLTQKYRYALQFLEMDKQQEKYLTDLIYRFQRDRLRKRVAVQP